MAIQAWRACTAWFGNFVRHGFRFAPADRRARALAGIDAKGTGQCHLLACQRSKGARLNNRIIHSDGNMGPRQPATDSTATDDLQPARAQKRTGGLVTCTGTGRTGYRPCAAVARYRRKVARQGGGGKQARRRPRRFPLPLPRQAPVVLGLAGPPRPAPIPSFGEGIQAAPARHIPTMPSSGFLCTSSPLSRSVMLVFDVGRKRGGCCSGLNSCVRHWPHSSSFPPSTAVFRMSRKCACLALSLLCPSPSEPAKREGQVT